jgi:hypothetical protein
MEAPDGASEDFKHATIERDNAMLVQFDFEHVHAVDRIRRCARHTCGEEVCFTPDEAVTSRHAPRRRDTVETVGHSYYLRRSLRSP